MLATVFPEDCYLEGRMKMVIWFSINISHYRCHKIRYCHSIIITIINLLVQKHDKVTRATKQIERDSKDTDATNSCPRKVQIKLVDNTLQK